jgi:DNA-binding transcriptional MerR regulator
MGTTFKAAAVLKALGIKHSTLSAWGHRGRLKLLGTAETRAGKPRQFSLEDVAGLAIMKRLRDVGLPTEQCREWADLCVSYMTVAPIEEFSICTSVDGEMTVLLNEAIAPRTASKVTIYPGVIIGALKARLGDDEKAEPGDDEETEA